jgi:hypothetical protein
VEGKHRIAFTVDIQFHLFELPKFQKEASELTTDEER